MKPFGFCCSVDKIDSLTKYNNLTMQFKNMRRSAHKIHESPTLQLKTQFTGLDNNEPRTKRARNRNRDVGDHRRKNYKRNIHNLKSARFKETNSSHTVTSETESVHHEPRNKRARNRNTDVGEHRRKSYKRNIHNLKSTRFKETNSSRTVISETESVQEDMHDAGVHSVLEGPLKWYLDDEIKAGKDELWERNQKVYDEYIDKKRRTDKKESEDLIVSFKYYSYNFPKGNYIKYL